MRQANARDQLVVGENRLSRGTCHTTGRRHFARSALRRSLLGRLSCRLARGHTLLLWAHQVGARVDGNALIAPQQHA